MHYYNLCSAAPEFGAVDSIYVSMEKLTSANDFFVYSLSAAIHSPNRYSETDGSPAPPPPTMLYSHLNTSLTHRTASGSLPVASGGGRCGSCCCTCDACSTENARLAAAAAGTADSPAAMPATAADVRPDLEPNRLRATGGVGGTTRCCLRSPPAVVSGSAPAAAAAAATLAFLPDFQAA